MRPVEQEIIFCFFCFFCLGKSEIWEKTKKTNKTKKTKKYVIPPPRDPQSQTSSNKGRSGHHSAIVTVTAVICKRFNGLVAGDCSQYY